MNSCAMAVLEEFQDIVFSYGVSDEYRFQIHFSSKPKSKPKKEKTEEERKFRRRAKYFLVTQLVVVLVFLSLLGGLDDAEVELDDDDSLNYND
ncbi:tRNA(His) guanylyltransferase 2 [Camellia lanceoleosa]|uniref:tRNA(His) guanylyltransferase 2 n=1 Tax=Camellia lanceoleosa TaxID=1840588 RepID=A0ACC0IWY6_9ERIC|nr:tRNA(His) guanylyltransferase 2 [Camellia lanceoleosa]